MTTTNTAEIENLRSEIRIAEHNVLTAAPDYIVRLGHYAYAVRPRHAAQVSLDALCRRLGEMTEA